MAFAGWENNPKVGVIACEKNVDFRVWCTCPNLKIDKNDMSFDSERYHCNKCKRTEYAYYDEMR